MPLQESSGELGLFVTSARYFMRTAGVASLATLELGSAGPCASTVTAATGPGGSPIFLISNLPWQTRNFEAGSRGLVLFAPSIESDGPLAPGRSGPMEIAGALRPAEWEGIGPLTPAHMATGVSPAEPIQTIYQLPEALERLTGIGATSR
jgi:hypothetical protein